MADASTVSFPISNSVNIKIGKGLVLDENGALSVNIAVAGNTLAAPGIAIFSANQFTVNANGMVQVKTATVSAPGIASFDSSTFVVTSTGRVQMRGATTATRGVVQLASEAEVMAGTDANKVVTPATLAKKLATITVNGGSSNTACVPSTLLNVRDSNSYPLNNGGNGTILVWDAVSGQWVPSTILQTIWKLLAAEVKKTYGGDVAVAEAEKKLFSYYKQYDFKID